MGLHMPLQMLLKQCMKLAASCAHRHAPLFRREQEVHRLADQLKVVHLCGHATIFGQASFHEVPQETIQAKEVAHAGLDRQGILICFLGMLVE